ncbi:translocation protein S66 [Lobulomyces angularis]|nr:translocation protein S66 [Lobulomyces angularis]
MIDLIGLVFPTLYVTGLGIVFFLFNKWNQLRVINIKQKFITNSYFGRHLSKDIYLELSEQYSPEDVDGKKLLCAALLKRAVEDVRRIIKIKDEKGPLSQLVKSGCVGEDLLENIVAAEEELNLECEEVVFEADLLKPGWKNTIFQEASQIAQNQIQKEKEKALKTLESDDSSEDEENEESDKKNKNSKDTQDANEAERLKLERELLEEEEKENKSKKSSIKKPGKKPNKKK